MSTTLTKTDPTCSNIELIDANICYGDALPIINSNIANLTATLILLQNTINSWENIVTNFSLSSVQMLTTMFNLQLINEVYSSPYSLIQTLSSQWQTQQFSVYYPNIIDVGTWYNDQHYGITTATNTLIPWLTANFPNKNFVNGQIINVFVNLSFTTNFIFNYQGSMIEYCTPQYHTALTLTCDGCGSDGRFAGCNHDSGGHHWCDNAYAECYSSQTKMSQTYTCRGIVGTTYIWNSTNAKPFTNTLTHISSVNSIPGHLSINYSITGKDTFITSIISYVFINNNSIWSIQS